MNPMWHRVVELGTRPSLLYSFLALINIKMIKSPGLAKCFIIFQDQFHFLLLHMAIWHNPEHNSDSEAAAAVVMLIMVRS